MYNLLFWIACSTVIPPKFGSNCSLVMVLVLSPYFWLSSLLLCGNSASFLMMCGFTPAIISLANSSSVIHAE
uniref:Transmembrane protein n=1 Tax=Medicago truncatula TaxID=3880 RepID=I3SP61_MEDTR|nr:unknown [Medicago truncatula]